MSFQDFLEYTEKIAKIIFDWEEVVQIAYYPNSDAIITAAIFGRTFYDLNRPCVLFSIQDQLDQALAERKDYPIIIIGSSYGELENLNVNYPVIAIIEAIKTQINQEIQSNEQKITVINPGNFGYVDSEASLSATGYFICNSGAVNLDYIVKLPLVACQANNIMTENIGLHDFISQDALTGSVIEIKKDLTFLGSEIFNISDTLLFTQFPFLPGLTGNERAVTQILTKSDIEIETKNSLRKLIDLDKDEITDLNSNLIVHLAQYKGHQEEQLVFIKPKTKLLAEPNGSIVCNTWDFAVAINDSVNRKRFPIALAVLMGNRTDKLSELQKMFIEERKAVAISFQLIIDHHEDVIELSALRYFLTDRKISWFNASVTAAMGLSNGLVTSDLPFAVVTPGPNELFTIGIRASKSHNIGKGLRELIAEILLERKLQYPFSGTRLSVQLSLDESLVDVVLLDLNSKLKEMVE